MNYDFGATEGSNSLNINTQPSDGRMSLMREFLDLEQEIIELRSVQERTAEQVEKAQLRRRELRAA